MPRVPQVPYRELIAFGSGRKSAKHLCCNFPFAAPDERRSCRFSLSRCPSLPVFSSLPSASRSFHPSFTLIGRASFFTSSSVHCRSLINCFVALITRSLRVFPTPIPSNPVTQSVTSISHHVQGYSVSRHPRRCQTGSGSATCLPDRCHQVSTVEQRLARVSLLTSGSKFENPADQKTICTKNADQVNSYLESLCPTNFLEDAKKAFKAACDGAKCTLLALSVWADLTFP